MTFDEKIQWFAHNDDDMEDFGDPGGYNESLDNEYEEEEEEESVGGGEERPVMGGGGGMGGGMSEAPRSSGGGGSSSRPARKPAKQKAASDRGFFLWLLLFPVHGGKALAVELE